jgi:hypothetical protein
MDMSARLVAYQKQTGRLKLTARQMRQVMRMKDRELRALRRIRAQVGAAISGRATDTTEGT